VWFGAEPICDQVSGAFPMRATHGGPRRPRSGCGRFPSAPAPELRARRLRMPVIRPVCLDLDESTGTTTTIRSRRDR
jgi:hypothetical protein